MKIVFTILLSFCTLLSYAQNKDKKDTAKKDVYKVASTIKTVRYLLKEKKYSNANDEITKATKSHEEARQSAYLYNLQSQALYNLVLDENKKMYLKQKPDTTKYFSFIKALYEAASKCDSLDVLPNEKGKITIKYRTANQQHLMQFRKNLSTADRYFYHKKDYKNAYEYADLYLSSKHLPIFTNRDANVIAGENDSLEHASLAVFLAYAYNNYKGVAKYLPVALADTSRLAQLYEVGTKSYYALGDTLSALELLHKGMDEFPANEYFYMSLIKYHNDRQEYDKGVVILESMVQKLVDSRNCHFLLAKEYEYVGELEKANEVLKTVIKLNAEDVEAYASMGSINLQLAHKAYDEFNLKVTDSGYAKGRERIKKYYSHARNAYEECRKIDEKNTALWLSGLRECYYKLNLGKELKNLEKYK